MVGIHLIALTALALIAGSRASVPVDGEDAALPAGQPPPGPEPDPVDELIAAEQDRLLGLSGVDGVGHGRTDEGEDAIIVWISDPAAATSVPRAIEGVPVIVEHVPGGFHAQ
ncbi:hypothetical protein [Agromyces binzhouensis]|uniref:hypothetical protein n=1 Tax=Agromyces binzhouensis TaxID=1817495 RepID=UPI0036275531